MKIKYIGRVRSYYAKVSVVSLKIDESIRLGDRLYFKGNTTDFDQQIESLQIQGQVVERGVPGTYVGVRVMCRCRKNDFVYKVLSGTQ